MRDEQDREWNWLCSSVKLDLYKSVFSYQWSMIVACLWSGDWECTVDPVLSSSWLYVDTVAVCLLWCVCLHIHACVCRMLTAICHGSMCPAVSKCLVLQQLLVVWMSCVRTQLRASFTSAMPEVHHVCVCVCVCHVTCHRYITDSMVVLTCCKGDYQSQWETPVFGSSQLENT